MKLAGDYLFEQAGVQDVWDALLDPAVLAAAMPGCEKLELVDGSFIGEIKVKVGPIQGKFSGKVDLVDKVEPVRYRMLVDGRGPQGFMKANASVELVAEGSATRIRYDADAQVGGKIASVGQRLVETAAKAIVKESLENLSENIKIRIAALGSRGPAAAPTDVPATPVTPDAAEPEPPAIASEQVASEHVASEPAAVVEPPEPVASEPVAAEPGAPPATDPIAALPAPAEAPLPLPVIAYKRADPSKMARVVAKAVGKKMLPTLVIVLLVAAIVIFLLTR